MAAPLGAAQANRIEDRDAIARAQLQSCVATQLQSFGQRTDRGSASSTCARQ